MRLTNFDFEQGIVVRGLGQLLDLHNLAEFEGIELVPEAGALRLWWRVVESPDDVEALVRDKAGRRYAIRFDRVSAVT